MGGVVVVGEVVGGVVVGGEVVGGEGLESLRREGEIVRAAQDELPLASILVGKHAWTLKLT